MRTVFFPLLLTLFTAGAAHLLAPSRAAACSCMQQSPADAAAGADAIFEGRVVTLEPPADGDQSTRVRVTVEVAQQWKGVSDEEVVLTTAPNSAMCGYAFELDRVYLIYANEAEGELTVSLCSRTQLADQATEDREHLGPGTTPVDPTVEDPGMPGVGDDPGESGQGADPDDSEGSTVSANASAQAGCASCAASPAEGLPALLVPGLLLAFAFRRR